MAGMNYAASIKRVLLTQDTSEDHCDTIVRGLADAIAQVVQEDSQAERICWQALLAFADPPAADATLSQALYYALPAMTRCHRGDMPGFLESLSELRSVLARCHLTSIDATHLLQSGVTAIGYHHPGRGWVMTEGLRLAAALAQKGIDAARSLQIGVVAAGNVAGERPVLRCRPPSWRELPLLAARTGHKCRRYWWN
jgi:hypothetical protein